MKQLNPAFCAAHRNATAQFQVVHAQTLGDFPQPGSMAAKNLPITARGKLQQTSLPVLGVTSLLSKIPASSPHIRL